METGPSGASGVLVLRRANKVNNQEHVNAPSPEYGGKECDGETKETQVCNQNVSCPGKLGLSWAFLICC